jgi:chromosome segregation ATPase
VAGVTREWSLPFSERYFAVQRALRELPISISRETEAIADHERALKAAQEALSEAERAWAWLQEHDADQIASLEAHISAVKAALAEPPLPRDEATR